MPEWLLESSNVALLLSVAANIALWRRDEGRQDRLLSAWKEGSESTASVAAVLESMERSIGSVERQTALVESTLQRCVQLLEEASIGKRP